MVVSLALQIGTNYVNDYADGDRGVDDDRVGPTRLVGAGLLESRQVKMAAAGSFLVAALAGLWLAAVVGPELLVVGALSIIAGWAYTGGPRPYGYYGLGELFVFVFFGVVATAGSTYVQTGSVSVLSLAASVPVGLLATALLVINNLRDIATDRETGKLTLAVRLGDRQTRSMYISMFVAAGVFIAVCAFWTPWALVGLIALVLAIRPVSHVRSGAIGRTLVPVLEQTGKVQLAMGAALTVGFVLA